MKINELIINFSMLIVAILLIVFGIIFSDKSINSPSDIDVELYKQFCDEGQKTIARFDTKPTSITSSTGHSSAASHVYTIKYFYTVDGVEYSGERAAGNLPAESSIEITYLKSKPQISSLNKHSLEEYEIIRNKKTSVIYSIIGFPMLFIGLLMINHLFKKVKKMF